MTRILYELTGSENRRFSPYCWRTRMALAHKGLACQYEPCGFTQKDKIAFSGHQSYPVLVDGDAVATDSWDIACYLDDNYRDAPSLFNDGGDGGGRAPIRLSFMRRGDNLVLDARKQRTVRRILDLRGAGMSYDRIAKQLNADGVTGKAGGKFYASTVHKIVGNDLHA